MKKVITILAILVVLVGAVFAADPTNSNDARTADGTATMTVKALVTEAIPQFRLMVSANQPATDASATIGYGEYAEIKDEQTGEVTGYDYTKLTSDKATAETALTKTAVNTLTGNGGATAANVKVKFDIDQVAKANLKAVYEITVEATRLELKSYLDGAAAPASGALTDKQYFAVADSTPDVAAGAGATGITLANSGNKLTVTYLGTQQVNADDSTNAVKLGNFQVEWVKNEAAVAGNYEGTVVMTVASK